MKQAAFISLLVTVFFSCKTNIQPTVYKDNLEPFNDSLVGHIHHVIIIGNSITIHPPKPEIGWNRNWGMAASSPDSDFVHLLMKHVAEKDSTVKFHYGYFANYESRFWDYPLTNFDSLRKFQAELIIMRIAENVRDSAIAKHDFETSYDHLIHYLDPDSNAQVLITNGVWKDQPVNDLIFDYASSHKLPFISFEQMDADSSLLAYGAYQNSGVAHHPNNKGMRLMSEKIWNYISKYFK